MKKKIILIGGGGHAESVIDSIVRTDQYEIIGILDQKEKREKKVLGVKIIGEDKELPHFYKEGIQDVVLSIGAIGNTGLKREIYKQCKEIGYQFPNIIDPSAILAKEVIFGEGIFIGKGAVINANVSLGTACIINSGSIIEHGCRLEDFTHVAPGSILCGNVKLEKDSFIGAGSIVFPNITVGDHSILGAGSLVLHPIASNKVAYGRPAREVREIG